MFCKLVVPSRPGWDSNWVHWFGEPVLYPSSQVGRLFCILKLFQNCELFQNLSQSSWYFQNLLKISSNVLQTEILDSPAKINYKNHQNVTVLLVNFLILLKLLIFFDRRISSKFTLHFFRIFVKVSSNIFKTFHTFPRHFTNFLAGKESSHLFKISSRFFEFNQKFFLMGPKFLPRLRGIF